MKAKEKVKHLKIEISGIKFIFECITIISALELLDSLFFPQLLPSVFYNVGILLIALVGITFSWIVVKKVIEGNDSPKEAVRGEGK